ncbi:RimJ/RimL family protein N-acetyltransferase [Chitinophaga niastensis]|uniref:RimJ/RimL family protein N-acetyltransferase n=1 Tax=Chitinophaga niastensis TaxID=536980 RepID=A0A2P8HUC9_CHINA|nr:GNAT family N-acetyltransferase [Chitinophaga niastensis]PSL49795.1 RimJ/RimL family protein N-acetyltransferase [Chitinophaga niastensis]
MKHFLPNGDELIIRSPEPTDAAGLLASFQRLTRETDYLLFTYGESLDLEVESEEDYIQSYLDHPNQLLLVAVVQGKIIGSVNLNQSGHHKKSHTGEMGIAIESAWNNMGIGRRLMTAMLRWAEHHPDLQIIYLNVFSTNEKAMQLYRNFGFMECGRLPQGIIQRNGTYTDLVTMYKRVKPAV